MSGEKQPLVLEQVAAALSVPVCDLAREAKRKSLGLVRAEPPPWCTDNRVVFFCPVSVESAVKKILEGRERLRAARKGVLHEEWTGLTVHDRDPLPEGSTRARPQQKNIQK